MDMDFRNIIRAELIRQGMTQTALAEKAGLTQARVSDYLRGRRDVMDDNLARMFLALGIAVKPSRTASKARTVPNTTPGARTQPRPTKAKGK